MAHEDKQEWAVSLNWLGWADSPEQAIALYIEWLTETVRQDPGRFTYLASPADAWRKTVFDIPGGVNRTGKVAITLAKVQQEQRDENKNL